MKDEEVAIGGVALLLLLLFGLGAGGEPVPPSEPKGPGGFKPVDPVVPPEEPDPEPPEPGEPDPEPPGPLPENPSLPSIVDPYPTPGHFYSVQSGDIGYGIAKRALISAGFLAAKEVGGLDDDAARVYASEIGKRTQWQVKYWTAIQCEAFNDAVYTTFGWGDNSAGPTGHGRRLRMLAWHYPNLQRIANGNKARRNMNFGKPSDKTKGNRVGKNPGQRNFPDLWLPSIGLKALWDRDELKIGAGKWPDGSSKMHPPGWIMNRGFRDNGTVTTTSLGCGPGRVDFSRS